MVDLVDTVSLEDLVDCLADMASQEDMVSLVDTALLVDTEDMISAAMDLADMDIIKL